MQDDISEQPEFEDLSRVFREGHKGRGGCGCAGRRKAIARQLFRFRTWVVIWPLFLFSVWRWKWVYLFCGSLKNHSWENLSYAVEWSHWNRMAYQRSKSVVQSVREHLNLIKYTRNPKVKASLKKALDELDRMPKVDF